MQIFWWTPLRIEEEKIIPFILVAIIVQWLLKTFSDDTESNIYFKMASLIKNQILKHLSK